MTNETFDPEAAASELATIGQMSEGPRRARLAILQTAALVDIARSLRPIAAEASLAMASTFGGFEGDAEPEGGDEGEAPDELEHGDLVTIEEDGSPFRIVSFGVDQDEPFAELQDLITGAVRGRVWVRNLTRYVAPDEGEEAREFPLAEDAEATEDAGPDITDVTDDIDDDFDGDSHDAAADALAALEASEKARKAGKGKKGGKKA